MRVAWPLLERSWREEAPSHWVEARVGEVALLTNGYPFDSATFGPSGAMPLARIRDLGPGPLETWVPDPVPPAVVLRDGDVVIGMDGDFNLAWWNKGPAALNQRLCLLRAKEDRVLQRYLVYVLPRTLGVINDLTYFTTVKHLASDDLLAEKLLLPPVEEQRRIVEYLDTETARIDDLVTEQQGLRALLDERLESLIFRTVTGDSFRDRRSCDVGWIQSLPSHWDAEPLGRNFESSLGKMLSGEAAAGDKQFPYLRNTNVRWDHFDLTDLATMSFNERDRIRCDLRAGDLLVCEGGEVGRCAVWPGEPLGVYFQKAIHRVRPTTGGSTRFLMYAMRAAASRGVFRTEGNQSTIVHLTGEQLRRYRFPFPPIPEQAAAVNQMDQEASITGKATLEIDAQIALLQEHRQALITAAVTGGLEAVGRVA